MIASRAIRREDIEEIRKLHEKFYPDLEFPNFFGNSLCSFVIEDEKGIVTAGGIEPIGEVILVTDQDKSRIKIGRALIEAQKIALYVGYKFGLSEVVAFVKNQDYARHLVRHGFYPRSPAFGLRCQDGKG